MINYAAETHRGNVRKLNEDCYAAAPELGLWLVADGVGGHASGDVASTLTRDTIKSVYRDTGNLVGAIESAHQVVLGAIARKEGGANMGSTVIAVALKDREYQIAWVGDSRAYLWDGTLTLLSTDHSFVEALVAKGAITREEAFKHPKRNVITQSIGVSPNAGLQVDEITGVLARGEKLLLCSDGLNDELNDASIANILSHHVSPEAQVNELIKGALDSGGRDNITIVVIDPDEALPENKITESLITRQAHLHTDAENPDLDRHTIVMDKPANLPEHSGGVKKTINNLFASAKKIFK